MKRSFGRETTPVRGLTMTMVINHLSNGMILQVDPPEMGDTIPETNTAILPLKKMCLNARKGNNKKKVPSIHLFQGHPCRPGGLLGTREGVTKPSPLQKGVKPSPFSGDQTCFFLVGTNLSQPTWRIQVLN